MLSIAIFGRVSHAQVFVSDFEKIWTRFVLEGDVTSEHLGPAFSRTWKPMDAAALLWEVKRLRSEVSRLQFALNTRRDRDSVVNAAQGVVDSMRSSGVRPAVQVPAYDEVPTESLLTLKRALENITNE